VAADGHMRGTGGGLLFNIFNILNVFNNFNNLLIDGFGIRIILTLGVHVPERSYQLPLPSTAALV